MLAMAFRDVAGWVGGCVDIFLLSYWDVVIKCKKILRVCPHIVRGLVLMVV